MHPFFFSGAVFGDIGYRHVKGTLIPWHRVGAAAMAKGLRSLSWLPVVDEGCCCCSLETCCKVQGWFLSVLHLVGLVVIIAVWSSGCGSAWERQCDPLQIAILTLNLLSAIVGFVATIMFLVGIYQRRPQLTVPYIVYLHFKFIIAIHGAIYVIQWLPYFSIFLTIPPLVLIMHMLVCANSLRLKIGEIQGGFHDVLGQQLA